MIRCSEAITASYDACKIESSRPTTPNCLWVSSVYHRDIALVADSLDGHYWHSNTVGEVLFSQALEHALQQSHFDLAVEIGAHPALKGPALQVIEDAVGDAIPYTGTLNRGAEDDEAFASTLGYIWANLRTSDVNFAGYHRFMNAFGPLIPLKGLPTYPWDHNRAYWHESRASRAFRSRSSRHELLGNRCADYSEDQISWKNSLIPEKLSWLSDHRIQGQMIFPGAAYIVSAFEAAREIVGEQPVRLLELTDFIFGQPLMFGAEDSRVEVLISLHGIQRQKSKTTANFTFHSIAKEVSGPMILNAHCQLSIEFGHRDEVVLQPLPEVLFGMQEIDSERIYESFASYGYQYTGPFRALTSVSRRLGVASGLIRRPSETRTVLHPATVDAAIHSILVAHSYPGDGRMSTPRVPTEILKISLNPSAALQSSSHQSLKFVSEDNNGGKGIEGRVTLFLVNSPDSILQIEGLRTKPMAPATSENDVCMFSETTWGPAYPSLQDGFSDYDAMQNSATNSTNLMAHAVEQLSHRYPGMHILRQVLVTIISNSTDKVFSIGADNADHAKRFLSCLNNAFASYTYTDSSDEGLDVASTILDPQNDKVTYKKFNPKVDASDQGFAAQASDLVVAVSMPPTEPELRQSLKNVRYLLRPGGYFITSQSIDFDLLDYPAVPEQIAAQSVDGSSGRFLLPPDSLSKRRGILEALGFAETSWPLHERGYSSHNGRTCVTLLQAIDDRVSFLRDPLVCAAQHPETLTGEITLIGGENIATSACAGKIETILRACGGKVARTHSVSLLNTEVRFGDNVLVLQDHDRPLFENFDQIVLMGLKRLFATSKNVVWVTHGYKRNAPYARMLVAFARCLVQEMAHVRLQILDFPSPDALDASLIAQDFLRLLATGIWEEQGHLNDLLWSNEPEISYEEGRVWIPRVKPSSLLNDRYNSDRRSIIRDVILDDDVVTKSTLDGVHILKATIGAIQPSIRKSHVTIHVTHSSLQAVKIERNGFFYLLLGKNATSKEQVVALSSTLSSRVDVPAELVQECPLPVERAVEYLHAMIHGLVSCTILRGLTSEDSVLVLEPDASIAAILPIFAKASGVRVLFSAVPGDQNVDSQTRRRASRREVRNALHDISLARIVCWKDDDWTESIRGDIPIGLPFDKLSSFVDVAGFPASRTATVRASAAFQCVQQQLTSTKSASALGAFEITPLADVVGMSLTLDPMAMVEWNPESEVQVHIEPVDHGELFQYDRTYWLVGLTGDLGLSLCHWMISKGARSIALSSRHPKVDPAWLAHFQSLGVTVKVLPCDVTDYKSVEATLCDIEASMPLIAGVCHGAMVLQDALFHDLDLARVEQVLKPKVDGAVHLDRVFSNRSLDFFIMLSSIAAVTGNPGQSIYAAANGFLAGLGAQRRARGECASTINMGAILGAGATRALTTIQQKSLQKAGVMWTSEQDFHTAFAEAVLANRTYSNSNAEFTTGVRVCSDNEEFKPRHASSPIFSHMLLHRNSLAQSSKVFSPPESIRARLLQATSEQVVFQILEGKSHLEVTPVITLIFHRLPDLQATKGTPDVS